MNLRHILNYLIYDELGCHKFNGECDFTPLKTTIDGIELDMLFMYVEEVTTLIRVHKSAFANPNRCYSFSTREKISANGKPYTLITVKSVIDFETRVALAKGKGHHVLN